MVSKRKESEPVPKKVFLNGAVWTLTAEAALIEEFQRHPEDWLRQLVYDGSLMKLLRQRIIASSKPTEEQLEAWNNTLTILEKGLGVTPRELDKLVETPREDLFAAIRSLLMKKAEQLIARRNTKEAEP